MILQVSYVDTGRGFILSFAIIAFISLTVGMWCYTLSSVYFWWYGVPATYFTVYTCCQYFGVALWGRDFQQSEHAKIVEVATEKGFMPTVDVFLPVCNEPILILANTWQYVAELDYPHLKVHVLDDGAQDEVRDLASAFGFKCEFIRTRRGVFARCPLFGTAINCILTRNNRRVKDAVPCECFAVLLYPCACTYLQRQDHVRVVLHQIFDGQTVRSSRRLEICATRFPKQRGTTCSS